MNLLPDLPSRRLMRQQRQSHLGNSPIPEPDRSRKVLRLFIFGLLLILLPLLVLEGFGWYLARQVPMISETEPNPGAGLRDSGKLAATNAALEKKIGALAPRGPYVVVDTAANRVYLRQGDQNLREMVASCGSGNVLEDPVGGRKWTFETPRGVFMVQSRVDNPVWIKPDWAFIEEGEEIPKKYADRAEPGMMGDYALGIGNGYFIHGTMYKRLLGRNVSHGCVRLGDEDLDYLVKNVPKGTKVIIY